MRLTESKLFDDLEVIMTVPERRTQRRTEIKRHGEWCGQVKGRGWDGQTSGRVEGSRLLGGLELKIQKLKEIKVEIINIR